MAQFLLKLRLISVKAKELMPCIDEGILQMQMVDFQSSFALKQYFSSDGAEHFWAIHASANQEKLPCNTHNWVSQGLDLLIQYM